MTLKSCQNWRCVSYMGLLLPQHPGEPGRLIAAAGRGWAEIVQNLYSLYRFPDTPKQRA